ncbi:DUF305 domain-containing protein [Paracoccus sp. TK19116]|uniref:DUF305 domain-containing protein n=1 Tax=Paracoccus albicereus TaxID=2922394 RepID=A0ABT1MYX2_9RHOB|nr:DUF305 domain-containing protein [Paracoccus albicereus]MCQ0972061.1 DUF305 domain-containing protein [Paracoccus albicereus]
MTGLRNYALRATGIGVAMAISAASVAAQSASDHGAGHGEMASHDTGSVYSAAMDTMMQSMDATELTGDRDADFLLLMIPHHQSAIDMAQALLEDSNDAEVAALAQAVIDTQQAEIKDMKGMLARLGHPID